MLEARGKPPVPVVPISVRVLVASAGNEFMVQIARMLAWGFEELNAPCEFAIDGMPRPFTPNVLQLVVAPHEFVPLFLERQPHVDVGSALNGTWLLNVEQPGGPWFEVAWRYARFARGVFDINEAGVRELRCRGVDASLASLGYAPLLAARGEDTVRDIDILFMGHGSARRETFLARHAAFFAAYRCALHLVPVERPRQDDTPGYVSGAERAGLLSRARIVLNVHSTERRYFESHRALLALAHGCLFVTETSEYTEPLVAGVHFVSAPLESLSAVCGRALEGTDFDTVAAAGRRFVMEEFSARHTAERILRTFTEAAASPREIDTTPRPGSPSSRKAVRSRLSEAHRSRASGHADYQELANARDGTAGVAPAITVLISLYNYEQYVGECLASVEASQPVEGGIEVLVVDDCSTDGSREVVRHFMDRTMLPVRLVCKRTNTGLADTRNIGLQVARGRTVFVLDADNWVYPSGLNALWADFQRGGVAAAYGLIQRFDDESGDGIGLLSQYGWNVRDLVRAPYIDAMALFDRRTLLDVGGYAVDLIEHGWFGWEDYAMWLALARAGHVARLVPQVVAGYRVHRRSMLRHTNASSEGLAAHFYDRFADLVSAHPDLDGYFGFPRRDGQRTTPSPGADPVARMWQERCDGLAREVDAFRNSASWKVTAPLRAAYEVWLRIKRR